MIPLRPDLAPGKIVLIAPEERKIMNKQGELITRPKIGVKLSYKRVGTLHLPTGRIARADPIYLLDEPPILDRTVPPGEYEAWTVQAAAANGDCLNAFAVLIIKDTPAVRYIDDHDEYAIGVDSAQAAILDASHLNSLDAAYDGDSGPISDRCDKALTRAADAAIVELADGVRAAVWHSAGDGVYNGYLGIDRAAEICNLVIDFNVVGNGVHHPAVPWKLGESLDYVPATSVSWNPRPWWKFW